MSDRRRSHRGGKGGYEPRAVTESRAQRAWDLDAAGHTQREIATVLGISQAAVSKLLRREADRRAADWRDDEARHRLVALNRETYVYRQALRGFERSQQDQTRRRQRQLMDPVGRVTGGILEADVLTRDGDPRFLAQAGRALARVAALNGLSHGRSRSTAGGDAQAARRRVGSQLDRLAAAAPATPVADQPE